MDILVVTIVIKRMKHIWLIKERTTNIYQNIQGITEIAKRNDVDAIHSGSNFLSESMKLAKLGVMKKW